MQFKFPRIARIECIGIARVIPDPRINFTYEAFYFYNEHGLFKMDYLSSLEQWIQHYIEKEIDDRPSSKMHERYVLIRRALCTLKGDIDCCQNKYSI